MEIMTIKYKVKIRNQEKYLEWVGEGERHHAEVDGIEFDGHRVLWRFEYVPETYLKESGLSGDEWRKGGFSRIYRNDICVWESFCREADKSIFQISGVLYKLMNFGGWDNLKEGYKLYYMETPAIIERVLDNGDIIVKVEDDSAEFPLWAYQIEEKKEDGYFERDWVKNAKVHVLDERLWWWRK